MNEKRSRLHFIQVECMSRNIPIIAIQESQIFTQIQLQNNEYIEFHNEYQQFIHPTSKRGIYLAIKKEYKP